MLNVSTICIHETKTISFADGYGEHSKWLEVRVVNAEGTKGEVALFYSEVFNPEDVEKAMVDYLESKGYFLKKGTEDEGTA